MEESVSTLQIVVEADKRTGGSQKKPPLIEDQNPASMSNNK